MATQPQPPTRSGLLPEARHAVLPRGIVASGFPRVRETCRRIGVEFDPWQTDLNRCILAKTGDGLYAADTVVLSIARQVGKTFDIGALVFAECIAEPGTTVIWTAHRFKVARETFDSLRALAATPRLSPHIDYDEITTGAGNEQIPFRNGSRIVFAARERGAIRGFTKVRILVLDEAQILTNSVLADLAPTMNQASNPLILLMGTPPKPTDPAEVFTELRQSAIEQHREYGHSEDGVLYVEFSAEPGSELDDRKAWREANPSYPKRTSARAILRLRKLLSDEDFRREALGIWDSSADSLLAIDKEAWRDTADADSVVSEVAAFGVAVAIDRAFSAIGAAGLREDEAPHLELVEHRRGTGWVVDRCVELDANHPGATFVIDGGGPAASLIEPMQNCGLTVVVLNLKDVARACGWLVDKVKERAIYHGPDPILETAVAIAKWRDAGDQKVFGRRISTADISSLESVTLAAHILPSVTPLDDVTAAFI